jgi:hypothetical protein
MSVHRRGRALIPIVSLLGLTQLGFLCGAAVMLLGLPISGSLRDSFIGFQAWQKQQEASQASDVSDGLNGSMPRITLDKVDRADRTFDGYTLYMTSPTSEATLVDMHGDVVHRWPLDLSRILPQVTSPYHNSFCSPISGYLYPNGDLLVVFHAWSLGTYSGMGMAKLDKDANVIWRLVDHFHHDVDVAEDGSIYALTQRLVTEPQKGFEYLTYPCMLDDLVCLSPDGKIKWTIPLLEAIASSPYAAILGQLEAPIRNGVNLPEDPATDERRRDALHTNHVQVLPQRLAAKFPMFKPGQILISVRNLDAIAVLDPQSRTLVWAQCGPWHVQHDPEFLDNGRLLIFDNEGGSPSASRVLEFDPATQEIPWCCSGQDDVQFYTPQRGMSQRLPNGNTLILSTNQRRILEVTADKELVWSCSCPGKETNFARRYAPEQLDFLDKSVTPR